MPTHLPWYEPPVRAAARAPRKPAGPAPTHVELIGARWAAHHAFLAENAKLEALRPTVHDPIRVVGWCGEPPVQRVHKPYWLTTVSTGVSDAELARGRRR